MGGMWRLHEGRSVTSAEGKECDVCRMEGMWRMQKGRNMASAEGKECGVCRREGMWRLQEGMSWRLQKGRNVTSAEGKEFDVCRREGIWRLQKGRNVTSEEGKECDAAGRQLGRNSSPSPATNLDVIRLNKFRELATCLEGFAAPWALIRKTSVPLPLHAVVPHYSPHIQKLLTLFFTLIGFPEWRLTLNFWELPLEIIFCFLPTEAVIVLVLRIGTSWRFVELQRFRETNIFLPYFSTLNMEALRSYELLVTTYPSNVYNHLPV